MNPLNLIQLNLQSPYEVWSESDDVYFFETDFGVKYKIYFGDDAPIWKTGAYTFDISNTNIIVQRNHPELKSILQTFDETIAYFTSKP